MIDDVALLIPSDDRGVAWRAEDAGAFLGNLP